ncbi:hypothetical protein [Vibrio sp. M260112]|uniref:hypothetical protein n=1 Tax=Vibrio sp. M260112 TaxID=3020895 RepID=UPI002F420406
MMTSNQPENSCISQKAIQTESTSQQQESDVKIINIINMYDVKKSFCIYDEKNNRLVRTKNTREKDFLDLAKIDNIDELAKTQLYESCPFLAEQKTIIFLPFSPIARSHLPIHSLDGKKINHDKIIQTFWKSELQLGYEKAEGAILVCMYLASQVDTYNLGLGITKTTLSTHLNMSVRRLSDLIDMLEDWGYLRFHTKVTPKGKLSLRSFIQLTQKFASEFLIDVTHPDNRQVRTEDKKTIDSHLRIFTMEEHFKLMEYLHRLRLDLKKLIWKAEQPIPTVVLQQVFKVLR